MHDLEPVTRLHESAHPLRPRQNFQISLNRYAIRGQAEVRNQIHNAQPGGNRTRFSVNDDLNS